MLVADEVVEDTESSGPKPKDLKLQRTDLRSLQKVREELFVCRFYHLLTNIVSL